MAERAREVPFENVGGKVFALSAAHGLEKVAVMVAAAGELFHYVAAGSRRPRRRW